MPAPRHKRLPQLQLSIRGSVRCGVQVRGRAPPRRLSPGLDFRDRPLHCLIHSPANLMVGLRYAFLVEVLA